MSWPNNRRVLLTAALWLVAAGVQAAFSTYAPGSEIDFDGDGVKDLKVEACSDCGSSYANRLVHLPATAPASYRAYSSSDWTGTDCDDALGGSYLSNSPFIPDPSEIILIKTSSSGFGKLRHDGTNTTTGMGLEVQGLACSLPGPPVANFAFITYDLVSLMLDTSTGGPTSWHWDFGDGTTKTGFYQTVLHVFPCFPFWVWPWKVCLTVGNAGGTGTPDASCLPPDPPGSPACCKWVWTWPVASVIKAPGQTYDLDNDGTADLSVQSTSACGTRPIEFDPLGSVTWTSPTGYAPYWEIGLEDVPSSSGSTSNFCPETADVFDTRIFRTSSGIVKAWFPENQNRLAICHAPPDWDVYPPTYVRVAFDVLFKDCPISVADIDLDKSFDTVTGSETHEACITISYGPSYTIFGSVWAHSGYEVVVNDGFEVAAGGQFTVEIGW